MTTINIKKLERLTGKKEESKPINEENTSLVRRGALKPKDAVPLAPEIEETKEVESLFKGVTLDRKSPELQKHFMQMCQQKALGRSKLNRNKFKAFL